MRARIMLCEQHQQIYEFYMFSANNQTIFNYNSQWNRKNANQTVANTFVSIKHSVTMFLEKTTLSE